MWAQRTLLIALAVRSCTSWAAIVNYSFDIRRVVSNPDGFPMSMVAVVNSTTTVGDPPGQRLMPGPMIRARKGDTLRITVRNKMSTEVTGIHWHGIQMLNNNWMDGMVGVTQPPINPMGMFKYEFTLTQSGTFWYHSHAGVQYNDGLFGPLIIDPAENEEDPVKKKYAYVEEHVIMLQEWFHERAEDLLWGYKSPFGSYKNSKGNRFVPFYPAPASSVLINGRGKFDCKFDNRDVKFFPKDCVESNPSIFHRESFFGPCDPNAHKPDQFSCPAGKTIRIRLIHSGVEVPIQFWIDRHPMIIVARDAIDVVPVEVDNVTLVVSERIDVIVKCNQKANSNYHIFARAYFVDPVIWSSAILRYDAKGTNPLATPLQLPATAPFLPLRRRNYEFSLKPLKKRVVPPATKRFIVQFEEIQNIRNGHPLEEIIVNNISFVMPEKTVLQEVFRGKPLQSVIGDEGKGPYGHRHMTNVMKLPYGEVVDIMLVSATPTTHPWHIHGYILDVIAAGNLELNKDFYTQGVRSDDCGGKMAGWIKEETINRIAPPLGKEMPVLSSADVVFIEEVSYVIFRLKLDNPGLWMFHCHINWHLENGMGIVFSVERNGKYPGLKPPPKGFPIEAEYGA